MHISKINNSRVWKVISHQSTSLIKIEEEIGTLQSHESSINIRNISICFPFPKPNKNNNNKKKKNEYFLQIPENHKPRPSYILPQVRPIYSPEWINVQLLERRDQSTSFPFSTTVSTVYPDRRQRKGQVDNWSLYRINL